MDILLSLANHLYTALRYHTTLAIFFCCGIVVSRSTKYVCTIDEQTGCLVLGKSLCDLKGAASGKSANGGPNR